MKTPPSTEQPRFVGGMIGEPKSWLVKPERPIKYFATRIHGLTNGDVANAAAFADIEDEVRRCLDDSVLVAHNAHVDVGVLQRHLGEWKCPEVFDTLRLAKRLLPSQMSYRLGTLVTSFALADGLPDGLSPLLAMHEACSSALTARAV